MQWLYKTASVIQNGQWLYKTGYTIQSMNIQRVNGYEYNYECNFVGSSKLYKQKESASCGYKCFSFSVAPFSEGFCAGMQRRSHRRRLPFKIWQMNYQMYPVKIA